MSKMNKIIIVIFFSVFLTVISSPVTPQYVLNNIENSTEIMDSNITENYVQDEDEDDDEDDDEDNNKPPLESTKLVHATSLQNYLISHSTTPLKNSTKSSSSTIPPLPSSTFTSSLPSTTTIPPTPTQPPKPPSPNCPDVDDGDSLTQIAFVERLTTPCRYDRLTRPGGDVRGTTYTAKESKPLDVYMQLDIRHIEAAENLLFKMHMLLQYRYKDSRLDFRQASPGRARLIGEDRLRERIWIPHVLLENERESSIMGHDVRDIYMAVEPDGEVTYSRRIKATVYCWMNLQKFPFDEQECDIRFLSWTYNASDMMLRWEKHEPVVIANQLHLTEYSLVKYWTEEGVKQGSRQSRGAFTGNYSCLTFRFHMAREIGYYMLDYFIPSIMLVCISWVSFWLQADASAPRITLGTSTMLSFITLATAQTRTLPKVSYIKASEIWFLGCTCFIFGSMVEFAFVNIIWRRKSNVELKKVNSKNILKCTLTPRLHRKELMKGTKALQKSHSCSSLDNNSCTSSKVPQYNNYLTVHSFSPDMTLPRIITESVDDLIPDKNASSDSISLTVPTILECSTNPNGVPNQWNNTHNTFTTMTPQEISQWIDKRSRLVFPCAFIVFNAFYWGFVYWL